MAGLKQAAWTPYMAEIMRVLKPGTGWIQATEFRGCHLFSDGDRLPPNSAIREFETYLAELIAEIGIYWNGEHLEQDVRNAGFIDVQTKYVVLEMGNWRGDTSRKLRDGRDAAGRVHTGAFLALIDHMKEKHYPDDEERAKFKERLRQELGNHDYRLWFDSYRP